MARRGHILTPKVRTESIPGTVIFTDTETEQLDDGTMRLLLGCYDVWAVDDAGMPRYRKEQGDYFTESGFYDVVIKHKPCRVIAHNWKFDAAVLRVGAAANMATYGYRIDIENGIYPPPGSAFAPFFITLDFDGDKVQLLCNTNYYKMPLDVIGNSLSLPKLPMPETADVDAMLTYCRRDVEILRRAYFSLFAFTNEIGETTPGLTAAMASNRVFRAAYYTPRTDAQGSHHLAPVNAAERAAYHGGRTDTFYKGTPTVDTVYKYDVNSLYPSCMLGNIPVRYLQRGRPEWAIEAALNGGEYIYLTDVTLNIPPESRFGFLGLEGVKRPDDGQLIFPVGRFRLWLWEPLLAVALKQDYVEQIHSTYMYQTDNLFDAYISDMYRRRVDYRKEGNEAYVTLTKLMMNSLYGKFAQRANDNWELVKPDTNEYLVMSTFFEQERFQELWNDKHVDYWQVGGELYAMRIDKSRHLAAASVCSIAGYITAKGRAVLWDAMATVLDRGGQLYMCDTDSVVCSEPLPDSLVSDTELGMFKLEQTTPGKDCEFIAPKHYRMDNRLVLKGIRQPRPDASEYLQDVFPNFMTDLLSTNPTRRERLNQGAVMRQTIKRPTGLNNKRIEQGANLPTLPIILDMA